MNKSSIKAEERIQSLISTGSIPNDWNAYDSASLAEFVKANPDHPISSRVSAKTQFGKVYDEKFAGQRANPANYRFVAVGSDITLDGELLP